MNAKSIIRHSYNRLKVAATRVGAPLSYITLPVCCRIYLNSKQGVRVPKIMKWAGQVTIACTRQLHPWLPKYMSKYTGVLWFSMKIKKVGYGLTLEKAFC